MELTRTARTGDGGQLRWDSFGSGEPLLLIAGQAVTWRSWEPLVPAFARHHRVIVFDHRGIGESTEADAPPATTRGFAADAVAVLDAAAAARAHVVGHSMGGRVAQWLAIDHPERVATLTLISTTAGDARGRPRTPEATTALASGDPELLGPLFFDPAHLAAHPEALDVFVQRTSSVRTRRRHFDASSTHDTWDELHRIDAPTLVVHGTRDDVTRVDNARDLAARLPDSTLIEITGGRHAVHLDHPEIADLVTGFIARHRAASAAR